MRKNGVKYLVGSMIVAGGAIGCWAFAALIAGLYHANWNINELLRQYMIATGMIKPFNTLVDFYTHIKGVEYLICVVFFFLFPLFYRYVNKDTRRVNTLK